MGMGLGKRGRVWGIPVGPEGFIPGKMRLRGTFPSRNSWKEPPSGVWRHHPTEASPHEDPGHSPDIPKPIPPIPEDPTPRNSGPHLRFQVGNPFLQLLDRRVLGLDHRLGILELQRRNLDELGRFWEFPPGFSRIFPRFPRHLLDHLPDFPLLALEHVVQVMDLLPERGHLLLQLG